MPKKRIPPSQRLSKEILELVQNLNEAGNNKPILTKLIEMSIRKTIQEILEKEVTEYIGKAYYESGQNRNGYRNGYKPAHIRTAECKIPIQRPQVDDTNEPFRSKVWPHLKGNTQRLEHIAVEMYARGCSTRDIEALLKDEYGNILLSKNAISQLNERLWQEYQAFCQADLSHYDIVYIFCDAVYESLRLHKSPKEGVLVVWGILSTGVKVLLTMELGNKESYDDWLQVFRNLKKRGLCDPVLGVTDGAPGLIKAFEEIIENAKKFNPSAKIDGVIVERMARGGVEVILGAVRDPKFGPICMFGLGGTFVEAMKDVTFRLAPMWEISAEIMIKSIKAYSLLKGIRGMEPCDIDAIKDCILRLSQMVAEHPEIAELDINPLIVYPEGQGCVVADSRILLKKPG